MLTAILSEMSLPDAKYKHYKNYDGRIGATSVFWSSLSHMSGPHDPVRLHGSPAADVNEAVQNAATESLMYIEGSKKIEFDCPAIKKMKAEMKRMSDNVNDRDRSITSLKKKVEEKDLKVRQLSKGFGICADDMYDSAKCLSDHVETSLSPGSTKLEIDTNWALYHVGNEAENLDHLSLMANRCCANHWHLSL